MGIIIHKPGSVTGYASGYLDIFEDVGQNSSLKIPE
jgi:hypothetical protein